MKYSNYHTHTTYSDGKHTPRENIEAAIRKGMTRLGFSDHSFTFCDKSYCMKESAIPAYVKEIRQLAAEYRDRLPVYVGLEQDYFSHIDPDDFDYRIGDVHYFVIGDYCYPIDHSAAQQMYCATDEFGGSMVEMAKVYYDTMVKHITAVKPTMVGHFDVINKFGLMPEEDETYRRVAKEALAACVAVCPYVEVNTGAISRKVRTTPYPARFLLEELLKLGGKPVLGSDSHHIDHLTTAFDETAAMLKEIGFQHRYEFTPEGMVALPL